MTKNNAISAGLRDKSAQAVKDDFLRAAVRFATDTFIVKRAQANALVPIEAWREKASAIKLDVLDKLPGYVDQFALNATRAGALVYRAKDARTAGDIVSNILRDRGVSKVVKSKSMITEEIHLNPRLEEDGVEVIETDLGEYIVQLAGESPSHILAPAIHKSRRDVGRLFSEKLGVEYTDDPTRLTKMARRALRPHFLTAGAGITGANFAIAETGGIVLFTNEGNGRMVTTLPRIHIAVISIEKMIPRLTDLAIFMRLLPRNASGQTLSSYVSIITGPKKPGDASGPEEMHIVLLDNGRSEIVKGPFREMLKCIRCSACLNVCPVYRVMGGHAYGAVYPGPMGIVLTSLLEGIDKAPEISDACTMCGMCSEVCPVNVPIKPLIRKIREIKVAGGLTPLPEKIGMTAFGQIVKMPRSFSLGGRLASLGAPLMKKIAPNTIFRRLP